jgi:hypothetical protein
MMAQQEHITGLYSLCERSIPTLPRLRFKITGTATLQRKDLDRDAKIRACLQTVSLPLIGKGADTVINMDCYALVCQAGGSNLMQQHVGVDTAAIAHEYSWVSRARQMRQQLGVK